MSPDSASSEILGGASSLPRFHVVTDDRVLSAPGFRHRAARLLELGGPSLALHLRGPHTAGRTLHALGTELVASARDTGSLVLVNDRIDVAMACGADGVQLGTRSLDPSDGRGVLDRSPGIARRPVPVMGASVHDEGEAGTAVEAGADFLIAGSVFATPSHPGAEPMGVDGLGAIVAVAGEIPVIGIGGLTPDRVSAALGAGAWGVAVLSGVWGAEDLGSSVGAYLDALSGGGADAAGPV